MPVRIPPLPHAERRHRQREQRVGPREVAGEPDIARQIPQRHAVPRDVTVDQRLLVNRRRFGQRRLGLAILAQVEPVV
jgi:hypothetical protein